MTSEQIERHVEHRMDRLDAWFTKNDSTLTQAEYDIAVKNLNTWAEYQYDHVIESQSNQCATVRENQNELRDQN